MKSANAALRAENDALHTRVAQLEAEVAQLREQLGQPKNPVPDAQHPLALRSLSEKEVDALSPSEQQAYARARTTVLRDALEAFPYMDYSRASDAEWNAHSAKKEALEEELRERQFGFIIGDEADEASSLIVRDRALGIMRDLGALFGSGAEATGRVMSQWRDAKFEHESACRTLVRAHAMTHEDVEDQFVENPWTCLAKGDTRIDIAIVEARLHSKQTALEAMQRAPAANLTPKDRTAMEECRVEVKELENIRDHVRREDERWKKPRIYAQLCSACSAPEPRFKCGHKCGRAVYCGNTCAKQHWDQHMCK